MQKVREQTQKFSEQTQIFSGELKSFARECNLHFLEPHALSLPCLFKTAVVEENVFSEQWLWITRTNFILFSHVADGFGWGIYGGRDVQNQSQFWKQHNKLQTQMQI